MDTAPSHSLFRRCFYRISGAFPVSKKISNALRSIRTHPLRSLIFLKLKGVTALMTSLLIASLILRSQTASELAAWKRTRSIDLFSTQALSLASGLTPLSGDTLEALLLQMERPPTSELWISSPSLVVKNRALFCTGLRSLKRVWCTANLTLQESKRITLFPLSPGWDGLEAFQQALIVYRSSGSTVTAPLKSPIRPAAYRDPRRIPF